MFTLKPALKRIVIIGWVLAGLSIVSWADTSSPATRFEPDTSDKVASNDTLPASITNEYNMTFVYIPPGEFDMGSPPDEPGRKLNERRHKVILSNGFYMMTTEVTQKQWAAVMDDNPSAFDDCGPDCPVENVAWPTVNRFVEKLNRAVKTMENRSSPFAQGRYRLPTEAQWEYACRAGSRGWFYFKGEIWDLKEYAWYKDNALGQPHGVAQKKANRFGLYDMHGNVWEWCQDYAGPYPAKIGTDPSGPAKGSFRIARGGSWFYPALEARCANRLYLPLESGNYNVGFRLVMTIEP